MFLTQPQLALDPIWRVTSASAADTRTEKMNLAIGVYRDEFGECAVQRAVRHAELRLAERSASKEYTGPAGNLEFNARMASLMFGTAVPRAHLAAVQSVGGTGALRLLAELLRTTGPERTVHLGTPAYVNHHAILNAAQLRVEEYPIAEDGSFSADAVLDVARRASPGDVILLQGCCHNPTGFRMPTQVWVDLAEIMAERELVPFIDHAYLGLGDGLDDDLEGMRRMLEIVPEAMVAVSAAKAWALYNERTGIAFVVARDAARAGYAANVLEVIARAAYSQAPSHGASVVAEILADPELTADWRAELDLMRSRLNRTRTALTGAIGQLLGDSPFADLDDRRGMFVSLPLGEDQMERLRVEHAIYGVPSGRINLAGVTEDRVPALAEAIASVYSAP